MREGTVSEDGSLGAVIGAVAGGPDGRIVDAQSSPDGSWLAVVWSVKRRPSPRLDCGSIGSATTA